MPPVGGRPGDLPNWTLLIEISTYEGRLIMWLVRLVRWMMMLSVVALVGGCVTTGGDYCQIAKPVQWSTVQELDATPTPITRQIVMHNEIWRQFCQ
ncbi:hypothetical protein ACMHYJ_06325 [Castellaniella hirudinis]|uniref:hypothetical protein n=1 Tax=Castellaniella hirudinis TaxID=1144617 RepID=UPI0039C38FD0